MKMLIAVAFAVVLAIPTYAQVQVNISTGGPAVDAAPPVEGCGAAVAAGLAARRLAVGLPVPPIRRFIPGGPIVRPLARAALRAVPFVRGARLGAIARRKAGIRGARVGARVGRAGAIARGGRRR